VAGFGLFLARNGMVSRKPMAFQWTSGGTTRANSMDPQCDAAAKERLFQARLAFAAENRSLDIHSVSCWEICRVEER
jgi:hypothetical protein